MKFYNKDEVIEDAIEFNSFLIDYFNGKHEKLNCYFYITQDVKPGYNKIPATKIIIDSKTREVLKNHFNLYEKENGK